MPKQMQFIKNLSSLHPVGDDSEKFLRRLGQGELVLVDAKRPRNLQFHRKFFAMLNLIYDQQDYYKSTDALLAVCKIATDHVDFVATKYGRVAIPKSISFAEMSEDSFAEFYDRACNWVILEVIPGLRRQDLDSEVEAELLAFGAPEG